MTKEEYESKKQAIKDALGKPEYDMGDPINEAAKQMKLLVDEYRNEQLAKSRPKSLKSIAEGIETSKYRDIKVQPIYLHQNDLRAFTDVERQVLELYFQNPGLNAKELAEELGINHQVVTGLFKSQAFKVLRDRIYKESLETQNYIALQRAQLAGDSKIILEVARYFGHLKNETLDINTQSKPIDDPDALKALKILGDSLASSPDDDKKYKS